MGLGHFMVLVKWYQQIQCLNLSKIPIELDVLDISTDLKTNMWIKIFTCKLCFSYETMEISVSDRTHVFLVFSCCIYFPICFLADRVSFMFLADS